MLTDSELTMRELRHKNVWLDLGERMKELLRNPPPAPQPPTKAELRKRREEERRAAEQREWDRIEQRKALVTFHANKRRAAKLQRTPPWADLDSMRAIYAEANRLTQETGIPHHVDHVIPLQGKLVSGLHVHNNLQILTGSENSKKRNHFEVEA